MRHHASRMQFKRSKFPMRVLKYMTRELREHEKQDEGGKVHAASYVDWDELDEADTHAA